MALFKSMEEKMAELKELGFFTEEIENNKTLCADYDHILKLIDQLEQLKDKANKKIEESKNTIDYLKQEIQKQKGIRNFFKRGRMKKHMKRLKEQIKNEEHSIKVADSRIKNKDLEMKKKGKEIRKSEKFIASAWKKMKEERYFAHFVLENKESLKNMYDKKVYDSIICVFEEIQRTGKTPYDLDISLKSLVKEIKTAIKDYNKRSNDEKKGTVYFLDGKQQLIEFMEKTKQTQQVKNKQKGSERKEKSPEESFKDRLDAKIFTKNKINAGLFKEVWSQKAKKYKINEKQFLIALGVLSDLDMTGVDVNNEFINTIDAVRSNDETIMANKMNYMDIGAKSFNNIAEQMKNNQKKITFNNLGEFYAYNLEVAAQYVKLNKKEKKAEVNVNRDSSQITA